MEATIDVKTVGTVDFPPLYDGYKKNETSTRNVNELYLANKFKKVFYGIHLRDKGYVAFFQNKKNADRYAFKMNKIECDNYMDWYTVDELVFSD